MRKKLIQSTQLSGTWTMLRDIAGYPIGASERIAAAVLDHVYSLSRRSVCARRCIPTMTTSHVGHVYKYAYGAAYDRACAGLRTHTAQAAMCRIHVAPSRRPSDVLLSSRNSALHSYRITYMLCARLLARARARVYSYVCACVCVRRRAAHTRARARRIAPRLAPQLT